MIPDPPLTPPQRAAIDAYWAANTWAELRVACALVVAAGLPDPMHDPTEVGSELLPCPFCRGGTTETRENPGTWNGGLRPREVISVEVRHWCEPVEGQPRRGGITFVGRDHASAVALWNRRG